MRRDIGSGMITGSIGGVLLWLYDHSFLLKSGAPDSPISDSLLGLLGIASDAHVSRVLGLGRGGGVLLYEYLIPLAVMVPAGAAVGALAARIFTKLFNR